MTSDLARRQAGGAAGSPAVRTGSYVPPLAAPPPEPHVAPARPPLREKAPAPVLVKNRPPVTVRMVQLFWILSLLGGAAAVAYSFIIRATQLGVIAKLVKGVDAGRAAATYDSAAQILYWCAFGGMVVVIFIQIVSFVSFRNRRSNVRWWQFGSLFLQGIVLIFIHQVIALGDHGRPLEIILAVQYALAILALCVSLLPPALHWSARKYDIRRGQVA